MYNLFNYINHFKFIIYQAFINKYVDKIAHYFNLLYKPKYFKIKNDIIFDIKCSNTNIPKNIFMCYKNKNIPSDIIANIQKLNPNWNIFLYDDIECSIFIHKYYGNKLGNIFDNIKDGPIKSDIFRICIIAEYGGVYSDIDNIIKIPLDKIIVEGLTFGIGGSYIPFSLNPAFIISTKNNKILYECINLYNNIIINTHYSYRDYSIVHAMTYVLNKYIKIENKSQIINLPSYNQKIQIFKEELKYTMKELFQCMIDPTNNLLIYYYLFDNDNNNIINLHNKNYCSKLHRFK